MDLSLTSLSDSISEKQSSAPFCPHEKKEASLYCLEWEAALLTHSDALRVHARAPVYGSGSAKPEAKTEGAGCGGMFCRAQWSKCGQCIAEWVCRCFAALSHPPLFLFKFVLPNPLSFPLPLPCSLSQALPCPSVVPCSLPLHCLWDVKVQSSGGKESCIFPQGTIFTLYARRSHSTSSRFASS